MATPSMHGSRHVLPIATSVLLFTSLVFLISGRHCAAQGSSFTVRDHILLNCGASGQMRDVDNRSWTGDIGSKFAPSPSNTETVTAAAQVSSVSQVPYMTARLSKSSFSYSLTVSPGRKFVRLYFYPANYKSHLAGNSRFSITANPGNITLLSNFNASRTAQALNFVYFVREFSVNVSSGFLNLTFTPTTGVPYAFVNGIEIISVPIDLFGSVSNIIPVVGTSTTYQIAETTALQTMYRLNVGGNSISPVSDIDLFRSWADDTPYIFGAGTGVSYNKDNNVSIRYTEVPPYAAPKEVYGTARSMGPYSNINLNYNLTWLFSVDPGFLYLVRMHFCEIQYPYTMSNMRVFSIYLNNLTATEDADVISFSGGIGRPVYRDFIVLTASGSDTQDFWVDLHPLQRTKPMYYDAILNGLEIFKLGSTDGNLAGPN